MQSMYTPQGVMQNNAQSSIANANNNLAFNSWMFNSTPASPNGFAYEPGMQCKADPSKMVPMMTQPMCPQFVTQNNGCAGNTPPLMNCTPSMGGTPPLNNNAQIPYVFDFSQFLKAGDMQNSMPYIVSLNNTVSQNNNNNSCANYANNCQRQVQQQTQQYAFNGMPFTPQQPIQDNRNINMQLQQNPSSPLMWMNTTDPSKNIGNSSYSVTTPTNTMMAQAPNAQQMNSSVFLFPMVQPATYMQTSSSRASSPTAFSSASSHCAGSDSETCCYKLGMQNNGYYIPQNQQMQGQMYHQNNLKIQRSNDDIMNMNMDNTNKNNNVCRDRSRSPPVFSMQKGQPININSSNVDMNMQNMHAPRQQMSGRRPRRNVPMSGQRSPQKTGGKRTKKYGYRSKQNKIDEVIAKLKSTFESEGKLVPENHGIRGPTVGRVHCKKWRSLNKIEEACDIALSDPRINTIRVSLPLSMKNKFQKKGFLVYWECETEEQSQVLISIFKSYDEKDEQGNDIYDEFQKINIALPTAETEITGMTQ